MNTAPDASDCISPDVQAPRSPAALTQPCPAAMTELDPLKNTGASEETVHREARHRDGGHEQCRGIQDLSRDEWRMETLATVEVQYTVPSLGLCMETTSCSEGRESSSVQASLREPRDAGAGDGRKTVRCQAG